MIDTVCPICGSPELIEKDVYFNAPESLPSKEYPNSVVCCECGYWIVNEEDIDSIDNITFVRPLRYSKRTLLDEGMVVNTKPPIEHLLLGILRELKEIRRKP